MVDLELGAMFDHALYTVGWAEVATVNAVREALTDMASNPEGLAREIIIQVIMFALTTVVLGGLYHRFVLVPQERKSVARRSAMLEPFRRMLVTRIASTHSKLLAALTARSEWPGNWGRPTIRSIRTEVAGLNADFAIAVLSNQDLLEQDEQIAVGKYSELLFAIQGQLDTIEQRLATLAMPTVNDLEAIIRDADASVLGIAKAFDGIYAAQITDLMWGEEFLKDIREKLIDPISRRAERVAAQIQARMAAEPPQVHSEPSVPTPAPTISPSSILNRLFAWRTPVTE